MEYIKFNMTIVYAFLTIVSKIDVLNKNHLKNRKLSLQVN